MTVIILVLFAGLLSYLFFPEKELPAGIAINRIEVYKSKRKMKVFSNDILMKTYTISLGKNPVGLKEIPKRLKESILSTIEMQIVDIIKISVFPIRMTSIKHMRHA